MSSSESTNVKFIDLTQFKWSCQQLKSLENALFRQDHSTGQQSSQLDTIQSLYGLPEDQVLPVPQESSQEARNYLPLAKLYCKMERKRPDPSAENIIVQFSFKYPNKFRSRTRMCDFELLASQPLSALRDALFCPCDFTEIGDDTISNNTMEHRKSPCAIIIENVVFVDERDQEQNVNEMSQPFLDWYHESCPEFAQELYKQKNLHTTRIGQLKLRLNHPYIFIHQGRCSHSFEVTQVRRLHAVSDIEKAFPHFLYMGRFLRPKCYVCDAFVPKFITVNDSHVHENPCLWCEACFNGFHYKDEENQELVYGDFQKYRYRALY